jgi:hypothetical protein
MNSDFTPLFEEMTKRFGLVTSAVYGRIWRFCQGNENVCRASLETMAKDIGVDRSTVMRHIEKLIISGYIIDSTPDIRNAPHYYTLSYPVTVAECNTINQTVAESNTTVAVCNKTVAESHLKIVKNIESNIVNSDKSESPSNHHTPAQLYILGIFRAKRLNIIQAQSIADIETKYGLDKFKEVANWAAKRGMSMGQAIGAIETSIPKWGNKTPKGNNGDAQRIPEGV